MPETQNGGRSVAVSPSQAGDSELVYLLVSHPCRLETQIVVSVSMSDARSRMIHSFESILFEGLIKPVGKPVNRFTNQFE